MKRPIWLSFQVNPKTTLNTKVQASPMKIPNNHKVTVIQIILEAKFNTFGMKKNIHLVPSS